MATGRFVLNQPYTTNRNGKKVSNPSESRLYFLLILDRNHIIKCRTEYKFKGTEWDQKAQRLKGPDKEPTNERLYRLRADLTEQYHKIREEHPDFSFEAVKDEVRQYAKNKEMPGPDNKSQMFFDVLELYITYLKGSHSEGSVKKANTFKAVMKDFCKIYPEYRNISFSMIDHNFYDTYLEYLRNKEPGKKSGRQKNRPEGEFNGLLNATVGKYIESLKTFCKWAEKRNHNAYSIYKEFKTTPQVDTKNAANKDAYNLDIISLSLKEFTALYRHNFKDFPHLARVRDLFCFGCFTGQRWSDVQAFNKNDIKNNVWSFRTVKTKEIIRVPLTGFSSGAIEILEKYSYQLPKISGQKFNEYIKKAADKAGITKEVEFKRYIGPREIKRIEPKCNFISSHTARRTFVSLMLNEFKMPPTIVQKITGHSNLAILQKYIDTQSEVVEASISKTPVILKETGPLRVAK